MTQTRGALPFLQWATTTQWRGYHGVSASQSSYLGGRSSHLIFAFSDLHIFKLSIFTSSVFTPVIFAILQFFTLKNPNLQSSNNSTWYGVQYPMQFFIKYIMPVTYQTVIMHTHALVPNAITKAFVVCMPQKISGSVIFHQPEKKMSCAQIENFSVKGLARKVLG